MLSLPPCGGGSGWGNRCLAGGRSCPFESVDRLQDVDLDWRRFPGERFGVRCHPHDEAVMVRDGQLRLDLFDASSRLGRVHAVGVAADTDQRNVRFDLLDVGVRIPVPGEPEAMPVEADDVPDPVVAFGVSLKPLRRGIVRGHRLELDPGDVQRLARPDGFDVAFELVGHVLGRDVLGGALLDLFDVGRLVVIGVRVGDEDHVGGLLLRPQAPGIDIYSDPLALPLISGLFVPGELLEHENLLWGSGPRGSRLPGQAPKTWTTNWRSRPRSSSSKKIRCQRPRARRPPATGISWLLLSSRCWQWAWPLAHSSGSISPVRRLRSVCWVTPPAA